MTMLAKMRQHMNWLKWSLGIVCLAFVIFYIPDFLQGKGADAASSDTVATVEGHEITAGEFRKTYQAQLQAYRSAYGNNMSEQLLKQLGVEQQILQQMVDERAALAEADRLHITASDEEVRSAHHLVSRLPGKWRVHRRAAVPAAAAHAAATDAAIGLRRKHPQPAHRREAARLAHRLDVDSRFGPRAGVPPPQRQGEARRRQLHGRQFPQGSDRQRCRRGQLLCGARSRVQDSREAQDPLPADRRRRAARESRRAGRRCRARLQQRHRAILDA